MLCLLTSMPADWEDPVQKIGDARLWEQDWDDGRMGDDFGQRQA